MNWVTLGANLTTMSDDVPLKLPRYVFRRANGSFRYKRNVPERLRPLIGKATLYRQLGDSHREAMQALPLVHALNECILKLINPRRVKFLKSLEISLPSIIDRGLAHVPDRRGFHLLALENAQNQ